MHDLLIIFVVLLVLLTLISTLGGSIYPKEHFADEELHEKFWEEQEQEPLPETFYQEEQEGEALPETFYQEEQHVEPLPEQVTEEFRGAIKIHHKKKEHFEEEHAEDVVEGFDGDQWAAISF